jgi:hypothetical protein
MRKNNFAANYSLIPYVLGAFIAGIQGCSPPPTAVFIDLSKVPKEISRETSVVPPLKPKSTNLKTQPALKGDSLKQRVISNDRREDLIRLRQNLEEESNQAVAVITERLKAYYASEIDAFYREESSKLEPAAEKLMLKFRADTRPIFEKYAKARAPKITRLTVLTEFPNPEKLIPIDGENIGPATLAKREEARGLQRDLAKLDQDYDAEIDQIAQKLLEAKSALAEEMTQRIDEKKSEIDQRALSEASRQIRRFSEVMKLRLFENSRINLAEIAIPAQQVNVPKQIPKDSPSQVIGYKVKSDSERNAEIRNRMEAQLRDEVSIWLGLHNHVLGSPESGATDATQEFIKWRIKRKAGL